MSQISPPIRVLLVAAIAFLAAWMLFLRPTDEPVPAAAPAPAATTPPAKATDGSPSQSLAGDAVQRATNGAAEADAKAQALVGEEPGAPAQARTGKLDTPPAQRGVAPELDPQVLAKLPKDVSRAVRDHKVLVLLFWNPRSDDDREVRRELRGVDRWGGRVFVDAERISRIARYAPITRGANVEQSPTVVVVDRALKAEALVGFVDGPTIDQAVVDALRNSDVLIEDPYLRKVNRACQRTGAGFLAQPSTLAGLRRYGGRLQRRLSGLDARVRGIPAPKRWRGFKRATLADHATLAGLLAQQRATIAGAVTPAKVRANRALSRRIRTVVAGYDRRMDAQNVLACGSNA